VETEEQEITNSPAIFSVNATFSLKFDQVQEQLETLASMDTLLPGMFTCRKYINTN
jgi:hypothetical protein